VLSGHTEHVEFQEQYSPVVRISITCIGHGPEHSRGLISTPFTTEVSCPEILQVKLIKSVEKVRGYYTMCIAKVCWSWGDTRADRATRMGDTKLP